MRAADGYTASNVSADTNPFTLRGGRYSAVYTASWGGGSVTLEILGPDGATYIPVSTAWSADDAATAIAGRHLQARSRYRLSGVRRD